MIGIATAIKDNPSYTFFFRTLSNQFANFACQCNFAVIGNRSECLFRCLPLTPLCNRQHGFRLRSRLATLCLGLSRFLSFGPFSFYRRDLCSSNLCFYLYRSFFLTSLYMFRANTFEILQTLIER